MSQIRFDRLQQLKEIDAKAFDLPIDDERVEHCATIALAIEDQRALLVAGKSVDHQVTLSLSAERRLWIKELVPPPPQPALKVEWVHGIGICPQCKYQGPDRHCTKCRAELSEADEDAIEECGTERRADKRSRPAPSPTTAETPPIAAAAPKPPPPPPAQPRSIHDLAERAGMVKDSYGSAYSGGGTNYGAEGGTPDLGGRF